MNILSHAAGELAVQGEVLAVHEVGPAAGRVAAGGREVAGLAQTLLARCHTEPDQAGDLAPLLAQQFHNLAGETARLLGEPEDREPAHKLAVLLDKLVVQAAGQVMWPGAELASLANTASQVAEEAVCLVTAGQAAAQRAGAVQAVVTSVTAAGAELHTAELFAAAGTLSSDIAGDSFPSHRAAMLDAAQGLMGDVGQLLAAAAGSRTELAGVAGRVGAGLAGLCSTVKGGATSLGPDQREAQALLLNAARDVCVSLGGLLGEADMACGQQLDHPAYTAAREASRAVISDITGLLEAVQSWEEEAGRGKRALQAAVVAITGELGRLEGGSDGEAEGGAGPGALLVAGRAVTRATQQAVVAGQAGGQESLLAAANTGRRAVAELVAAVTGQEGELAVQAARCDTATVNTNIVQQFWPGWVTSW